jgi:5,10-methenyltetrahydrofolate synthetase
LTSVPPPAPANDRQRLRQRLLDARAIFATGPDANRASTALARHLEQVLVQLEPQVLGLYWPRRGEFNAVTALESSTRDAPWSRALPWAHREPRRMDYRTWDGATPTDFDECGIPAASGRPVVPDVVLVPCVGFTPEGERLGYGGGYFDRWLAAHPGVTAVGVAWALGRLTAEDFRAEAHDIPLALVVTELGVA